MTWLQCVAGCPARHDVFAFSSSWLRTRRLIELGGLVVGKSAVADVQGFVVGAFGVQLDQARNLVDHVGGGQLPLVDIHVDRKVQGPFRLQRGMHAHADVVFFVRRCRDRVSGGLMGEDLVARLVLGLGRARRKARLQMLDDDPKLDGVMSVWEAADGIELFDSAWNFDHFYPIFSDSTGPCLEAWTMLAALPRSDDSAELLCELLASDLTAESPQFPDARRTATSAPTASSSGWTSAP